MIYLVNHNRYKEFFKTGFFKYMPDFLLPKYKARVLDNILKGEEVIGHILGINLKEVDLSIENNLDEYINNILSLKSEDDTLLYIEGLEDINVDILKEIETRTSMTIPTGESIWLYNVPIVMNQLLKGLNEDSFEEEVLIICGQLEKSLDLIRTLSKDLRFISIIGNDGVILEQIYETILEDTGISLFQPVNIVNSIKNYSIIINLSEDVFTNLKNIRRKATIFDCSISKHLTDLVNSSKNNIIIDSISINISDTDILTGRWIENEVSPKLYELLMADEPKEFYRILWKKQYYFLKDFINREIKIKGTI